MKPPSPSQQGILDRMKQGHILSSKLSTKYILPGEPAEGSGALRGPNYDARFWLKVPMRTIKAMLENGCIIEKNRYICSSGWCGEQETETWRINYTIKTPWHCAQEHLSALIAEFNTIQAATNPKESVILAELRLAQAEIKCLEEILERINPEEKEQ